MLLLRYYVAKVSPPAAFFDKGKENLPSEEGAGEEVKGMVVQIKFWLKGGNIIEVFVNPEGEDLKAVMNEELKTINNAIEEQWIFIKYPDDDGRSTNIRVSSIEAFEIIPSE